MQNIPFENVSYMIMMRGRTMITSYLADSNYSSWARPPLDHINISVLYNTLTTQWVTDQHHGTTDFLTEEQGPLVSKLVHINYYDDQRVLYSTNTHQYIKRELNDLPLSDYWREKLTRAVLCYTRDKVNVVSPENNVLNVVMEITHKHDCILFVDDHELELLFNRAMEENSSSVVPATESSLENNALELLLNLTMEESTYSMVPATESSITLLESKTIGVLDGTCASCCSICLEEFFTGCQAECMPCSHLFHGDCIVPWLRTSHYCPVCRFAMPIRLAR